MNSWVSKVQKKMAKAMKKRVAEKKLEQEQAIKKAVIAKWKATRKAKDLKAKAWMAKAQAKRNAEKAKKESVI